MRGELRTGEPMARHTTWRVGGPADRFFIPADTDDLAAFLQALDADEPLTLIGLGSNLLVRDGGLRGTVIGLHGALTGLRREGRDLYAEAGVTTARLARFAAGHDLSGAEFWIGIPGTVGGALAMNAGCHGSETWERVKRVRTIDRRGHLHERNPGEYRIGYRQVKLENGAEEWFVAAWFHLQDGNGERARTQMKTWLERRSATQPLQQPNAGSVFRNPPDDHAGRLIEAAGLKGYRIGDAQVSEKHANFIVNRGAACATDIEALLEHVRSTVKTRFGIELVSEVKIIGEAS